MIQPHIEGLTREERALELANTMSLWEKRPANTILASERDVIEKIIQIADENAGSGLRDVHFLLAAENMIKYEFHEAKFHLEALHQDHRQELLKRATQIKDKGRR